MSDNETNNTSNQDGDIGEVPQSPVVIHKQYLKDFSFENPNAPGILKQGNARPEIDMSIMLDVKRLEDEEFEHIYEVSLAINASAERDGEAMFIAEILYSGVVSINGLEEKHHHSILFIEVPAMLFPFARQILAHCTQAGGFIPLQLSPVDFRSMYLKRFGKKQEQKQEKSA